VGAWIITDVRNHPWKVGDELHKNVAANGVGDQIEPPVAFGGLSLTRVLELLGRPDAALRVP
jgi:hypothetical protein